MEGRGPAQPPTHRSTLDLCELRVWPFDATVAGGISRTLTELSGRPSMDRGGQELQWPSPMVPKPGERGQHVLSIWEVKGQHLLEHEWAEVGVTLQGGCHKRWWHRDAIQLAPVRRGSSGLIKRVSRSPGKLPPSFRAQEIEP